MRWAIVAAVLTFAAPAYAAPAVQIAPVLIDMPASRPLAFVRLTNPSSEPLAFTASAMSWTQADGADRLAETGDIVISPPAFVIAPGKEQIVRLGALAPAGDVERAYRLRFSQTLLSVPRAGAQMRYEFSLPLFVAPRVVKDGGLTATQWAGAAGEHMIRVENGANRRVQLFGATAGAAPVSLPRYLLAGASATVPAPSAAGPALRVAFADAAYVLGERDLPLASDATPRSRR